MKWLVIQSDGEHKGQDGWTANAHMRECYSLKRALEHHGHQADIWGLRHDSYAQNINFSDYDCLFIAENYELDWLPDLDSIKGPLKIFWIIDGHWRPADAWRPVAAKVDIILHSTRSYIDKFSASYPSKNHLWFPNAADDLFFNIDRYPARVRQNELIFIGGNPEPRRAAIERMEREAGLWYRYGVTGQDYIDALRMAKMQWNMAINGDINYRNFETIGLGCCLLTNYDADMEQYLNFVHEENCLFYRNIEEAVRLAQKHLHDGSWQKIAEAGYSLSKQHTYKRRIERLLNKLLWNKSLWNKHTP